MSVMIGVDPHKGSHAAVAVDEHEEAIGEVQVRATPRQTTELLGWADRFPQRSWAIDSANGHWYLLAQQLIAAGEHVVDVPAARVRVLDSTRSQKNDPNDARSVAIVALRQSGLRVVETEDHVTVLRMGAKRHKQLAGLKTQAASRLYAVLAALILGGLGKEMVPKQASQLLQRVRPATMSRRNGNASPISSSSRCAVSRRSSKPPRPGSKWRWRQPTPR